MKRKLYRAGSLIPAIFLLLFLLFGGERANAQIQIGTIRGNVADENSAAIQNARVRLSNAVSGFSAEMVSGANGEFVFRNVPFGTYQILIFADKFARETKFVDVRSNAPVNVALGLRVAGASETVNVTENGEIVDRSSTQTEIRVDQSRIARTANTIRARALQRVVAQVPGAATQNNGLIQFRGVEDGILYVVDGVPTNDRIDAISAGAFDADDIRSLNVITGNFPAEFGGRNAAVVQIQPRSGINSDLFGGFATNYGNFRTNDVAGNFGGATGKSFGFYLSGAASRSTRYLDPVDERNFNNRGRRANFNFRGDWQPAKSDFLIFNAYASGTNFRVPNDFIQELAGQRQRQQLRDYNLSASWERVWSNDLITNLAVFRRDYKSELTGSEFDTPLFAAQNRRHARTGIIGSLTQIFGGHNLKYGFEAARITPREFFTFAVTDEELAEEREVSEEVQEFTLDDPFIFRERRNGAYAAAYAQDSFSPLKNLTVSAGLRFDYSSLPAAARQFSPRVGAVYFIEKTKTSIRASFNRLYQPPQIENLLLGNSAQARALSPFSSAENAGGADVRPERVSAWEIGGQQNLFDRVRLDIAYWQRYFRNFGDPNTFFNTTIVFPNSVARGRAKGLDVRVDVPEVRGFSGFLSYTNSRIIQFGPINGGLFLTDEFIEIGDGTRFTPDQDQRNTGAFGVIYNHRRRGIWASINGRHESGVPLEVDDDRLEDLMNAPGADLVNFERGRVRPWTIFDFAAGADLLRKERVSLKLRFEMQNFTNNRFAYNFGSPFEGTHFGHPRLFSGGIRIEFR